MNDEIALPNAFADNRGSLLVSAFVDRPHRKLARRITFGNVNLRPLSLNGDENGEAPSVYVRTQDFETAATRPHDAAVFLLTEPSADATSIALTAFKVDADTYAFQAENFPAAPSIDTSRHNLYLMVQDDQTVCVHWARDIYARAFFYLREPLAKGPGTDAAVSLESGHKQNLFLWVDPDGRLRALSPNGTEDFNRSATWGLEQ